MKKVVIVISFLTLIASLFGCTNKNISDGDGMEYDPTDYQTEYANALEFEKDHADTFFGVIHMGDGKNIDIESFAEGVFPTLPKESLEKIEYLDLGGDKAYFIIPRYKGYVIVKNTDTDEKQTVEDGVPFVIKSSGNIEISIDFHGGRYYTPKLENGRLTASDDIWDMTKY